MISWLQICLRVVAVLRQKVTPSPPARRSPACARAVPTSSPPFPSPLPPSLSSPATLVPSRLQDARHQPLVRFRRLPFLPPPLLQPRLPPSSSRATVDPIPPPPLADMRPLPASQEREPSSQGARHDFLRSGRRPSSSGPVEGREDQLPAPHDPHAARFLVKAAALTDAIPSRAQIVNVLTFAFLFGSNTYG